MVIMNILISGGAGFVGSHLSDFLISQNYNVIIIDNLSTGNFKNLNPKAIFIQRDIKNNLSDIFDQYQFDYVYHFRCSNQSS